MCNWAAGSPVSAPPISDHQQADADDNGPVSPSYPKSSQLPLPMTEALRLLKSGFRRCTVYAATVPTCVPNGTATASKLPPEHSAELRYA